MHIDNYLANISLQGASLRRMETDYGQGEAVNLRIIDCGIAHPEDNMGCTLTLEYSGNNIYPLRVECKGRERPGNGL